MKFFKLSSKLYPLIALLAGIIIIVFGLIEAKSLRCTYFLAGVYVILALFGCYKACLKVLPPLIIIGGIFATISYFTGGANSAIAMANRFGAIFFAIIPTMSMEAVRVTRSLSQLHTPRAATLGMLIAVSFVPMLRGEIKRVREAMKTRGANGFLNPRILYRAFLVPLVMRLVNISDTLALSVETRGFMLGKCRYTVYKTERFYLSDLIFIILIAAAVALTVLL